MARANKAEAPAWARELSVGEVARRSGVAVSALHFYEKKGLIHSLRNAGNQRRYPHEVLRRVSVIKVAQRLGIPLATVKEAMDRLPKDRKPTAAEWRRMSAAWRVELDARIQRMVQLRDALDGCIGCGRLSLKVCPLHNPHDTLGEQGAGARLLDPED